jgi:hypothetical protein
MSLHQVQLFQKFANAPVAVASAHGTAPPFDQGKRPTLLVRVDLTLPELVAAFPHLPMGASAMPHLQATHGHIVDVRRHTNVHLYWRGRFGPAERYELWLRDPVGCEHQFTIHTRTLPARRGHEVTLLAETIAVRAVVN